MQLLYNIIAYLIMPWVVGRLLWRATERVDEWRRMKERFGLFKPPPSQQETQEMDNIIWLHAVSLGEVNAAIPLIRRLVAHHPESRLLVTTTTQTGSRQVQKQLGDCVTHLYFPYDLPGAVRRYLQRINPSVIILMETELWPNLIHAAYSRSIPVLLANARLSGRSMRGYRKLNSLTRTMLKRINCILAQSEQDAERFIQLGAPTDRVIQAGNLKFEMSIPEQLHEESLKFKETWGMQRPVWVAASTHPGEETYAFEAHRKLIEVRPDALLVIVPRHPDQFDLVYERALSQGFVTARRSEWKANARPSSGLAAHRTILDRTVLGRATQVLVVDRLGELMTFYAASDLAFVGGSLVGTGGHNLLEPAALSKPILSGPNLFNFAWVSELLLKANALKLVTKQTLPETVIELMQSPEQCQHLGTAAKQVFDSHQGALEVHMKYVEAGLA